MSDSSPVRDVLPLLVRVAVAGLMITYGVEKMAGLEDFLKSIHSYGVLPTQPPWLLNLAADGIPVLEIFGGLCLLFGFWRRAASLVLAFFLVVFTAAILWRTFQVMDETGQAFTEVAFDCGCGSGVVVIWEKTLFNLTLLLGTLYVGFRPRQRRNADGV